MREVLIKNKEILERLDGFIESIKGLDIGYYFSADIKEQRGDKGKHICHLQRISTTRILEIKLRINNLEGHLK